MAKQNFKNFDRMFSEMKHETIPFQVYGKTWHIKKAIPAVIVLEMARYEDGEGVPNSVLFRAARPIFGDQALNEWCAQPDFSADKLSAMIRWAFQAINSEDEPDSPEPVTEDDMGEEIGRKN